MPTVLRRSGPDILTRKGSNFTRNTPRAMIHFCEDCGFEGAAFGTHAAGTLLSYCGWQNGAPVCIGKGWDARARTLGWKQEVGGHWWRVSTRAEVEKYGHGDGRTWEVNAKAACQRDAQSEAA